MQPSSTDPHATHLRDLFHARGLRHTRQRELVFDALRRSRAHPTAEELFLDVQSRDPGLSLATVYNTLEALRGAGLCRRVSSAADGGSARFDADVSDHAHLTSPDGRVLDAPDDISRRLLDAIPRDALRDLEARLGVRVDRVNIHISVRPVASDAAG